MKPFSSLVLVALSCCIGTVHAATDLHRQLLVFQKTGKIDIFYTDELENIEFSKFDKDSLEYNEYVSQVFRSKGGKETIIPLAEIDSVTFGSRKQITPKNGVRCLTDEEASAIVKFMPKQLTYAKGTPPDLIVKKDEIIYYERINEVMPYGLCAKIKAVHSDASGTIADIEYLDPAQVFDAFIVSESDGSTGSAMARAPGDIWELNLPETDIHGCKAKAEIKVKVSAEIKDWVCDIRRHYYHGIIDIDLRPYMGVVVSSEDSGEVSVESTPLQILHIPVMGGLSTLNLDLNLFLDIMAQLGIEYEFSGGYGFKVEWTRDDGADTFSNAELLNHNADLQNKIEAHLKGELFCGVKACASISLLFNSLGVGVDVKMGPSATADFDLGCLQRLSEEYDEELYGNAKIGLSLRSKFESYVFSHDTFLVFGNLVRQKLPFAGDLSIDLRTINLFPELRCRSTYGASTENLMQSPSLPKAIDVASYTETEIDTPLETGFEIADKQTDEVICQSLEEENIINPQSTERQNFSTEIPVAGNLADVNVRNLVARPVFKYAGYVIKAPSVSIGQDIGFSPVITAMNANGVYMVSGMTPVSQLTLEETTFIEGNIIPHGTFDNPFKPERTFTVIDFDNVSGSGTRDLLLGTWHGNIDGNGCVLIFLDDSNGNYNGVPFTYSINAPVKGAVSIKINNGNTITFYVTRLTSEHLNIIGFKNNKEYFFTK